MDDGSDYFDLVCQLFVLIVISWWLLFFYYYIYTIIDDDDDHDHDDDHDFHDHDHHHDGGGDDDDGSSSFGFLFAPETTPSAGADRGWPPKTSWSFAAIWRCRRLSRHGRRPEDVGHLTW